MNRYTFIIDADNQEVLTFEADSVSVTQFGADLYVADTLVGHVRRFDAFSRDRTSGPFRSACPYDVRA